MPADLLELTAQLVEVPSVSHHEQALCDLVEARLTAIPWLETVRIGDNLVARTRLGRPLRLVLAGHLDTVPGAVDGARRDGDVLWGLGAADMKGALAVMLELARNHPEPALDLTFVFYAREEVAISHSGLREIDRARPDLLEGDVALLGEPTALVLEAGCQGTMRVRVTLAGRRAHTARAWMGRNAVHRLGALLGLLQTYEPRRPLIQSCQFHEALQAVFVSGGAEGNVVPDQVVVTLNHRFAPDRSAAAAEAGLRELLAPVLEPDDHLEVVECAPAAPPRMDHPVLAAFSGRYDLAVRAKLGWTDVAFFAERGVPAANFGPGDPELSHTADERIERRYLDFAYGALADLIRSGV